MALVSLSENRYFSSLAHRDYQRLFISTSAAGLANWSLIVARGWLAYHLTSSSAWVGVVTFAGFLPFILGPVGGVLADRYERRQMAALSTVFGLVFSLLLATLTMAGSIQAWHLAAITLLMSVPRAGELPARQALIANVVPGEKLVNAVALSSVATFGTRAVGPAVVIPLIDTLGVEGVFFLAAGFYAVSTLSVLRIEAGQDTAISRMSTAAQNLREGMVYILRTPPVASLMYLIMFHCAFTMSFDSLLPVFAVQQLHSGGASFSALAMGVGLGALAGSIFVSGARGEQGKGRILLVTGILSGIAPMAMALPMSLMSLPVAFSSTVAMGATQAAFMALSGALIQVAAPDELRGRVSSIYLLFAGGLMAWVNLINGVLADIWDVPLLFLVPAAIYLVAFAVMWSRRQPLRLVFREGSAGSGPLEPIAALGG